MSTDGGLRPVPDPTLLTTEQLLREINGLRELMESKLTTLDTKMTGHFLIDGERFSKIDERFDTIEARRLEQKADTKLVVEDALTAQREAVAKQDEANQKAITKAEAATADTIRKLEQLVGTQTSAINEKVDDLRARLLGIEARKEGSAETRQDQRANIATVNQLAAIVVAFLVASGLYLGLRHNSAPVVVNTPTAATPSK